MKEDQLPLFLMKSLYDHSVTLTDDYGDENFLLGDAINEAERNDFVAIIDYILVSNPIHIPYYILIEIAARLVSEMFYDKCPESLSIETVLGGKNASAKITPLIWMAYYLQTADLHKCEAVQKKFDEYAQQAIKNDCKQAYYLSYEKDKAHQMLEKAAEEGELIAQNAFVEHLLFSDDDSRDEVRALQIVKDNPVLASYNPRLINFVNHILPILKKLDKDVLEPPEIEIILNYLESVHWQSYNYFTRYLYADNIVSLPHKLIVEMQAHYDSNPFKDIDKINTYALSQFFAGNYDAAAKLGCAAAQYRLFRLLTDADALRNLKLAANNGYAPAQVQLGNFCYQGHQLDGFYIPQDQKE